MQRYRAAELKHGRVCMLAALGQITQHFTHWDDPSGIFDKSNSAWGAMQQVRHPLLLGLVSCRGVHYSEVDISPRQN